MSSNVYRIPSRSCKFSLPSITELNSSCAAFPSLNPLPNYNNLIKPIENKYMPRNASRSCKLEKEFKCYLRKSDILKRKFFRVPVITEKQVTYTSIALHQQLKSVHTRNSMKRAATHQNDDKENMPNNLEKTIEDTKGKYKNLEKIVNEMLTQSKSKKVQSYMVNIDFKK